MNKAMADVMTSDAKRLQDVGASRPDRAVGRVDAEAEWKHPLTGAVIGLLLFETITGLTIYLLPFSIFNQFGVLLHTVIGVAMFLPFVWYLGRHWWRRFHGKFNHFQLLGYVTAATALVLFVSGFVLTYQSLFDVRISYGWDLAHIVFGFVFLAAFGAHLITLLVRRSNNAEVRRSMRSARMSCFRQSVVWGGVLMVMCAGLAVRYADSDFDESFSGSYSFRYGEDRPFAPSLARKDMSGVEASLRTQILSALTPTQRTQFLDSFVVDPTKHVGFVTVAQQVCESMELTLSQRERIDASLSEARKGFRDRGRIDARQLAGSAGCGTSGCHSDILAEWQPSAHRYASMDFVF